MLERWAERIRMLPNYFHSIQIKFFISCSITALVSIFLTTLAVYKNAVSTIENNAANYIYDNITNANDNLNVMMEDSRKISTVIVTNHDTIVGNILSQPVEGSYDWFLEQNKADTFLKNVSAYKPYIDMVAVVGENGKIYQTGGELLLKNVTRQPWFQTVSGHDRTAMLYNVPDSEELSLCRPIFYNSKAVGVVIIELNYQTISDIYNVKPLEYSQVLTYTDEGDIVFSSSGEYIRKNIHSTIFDGVSRSYDQNQKYYMVDGQKNLVVKYTSQTNQLTTICFIPYDRLITDALMIRRRMVVVILLATSTVIAASYFLTRKICFNINRLKGVMTGIKAGNLEIRAQIREKDEIGVMASIFDDMMDHVNQLMADLLQKEKQKQLAQQQALQAQIQPHFICNALNSIRYVAKMNRQPQIEEVATSLAELLRCVLSSSDEFIPIEEELRYTNEYMKIQRFKYQKNFRVDFDIEKGVEKVRIPKLLLQPIIENALLHGISQVENGLIDVKIFREKDQIRFEITDNGIGMTEEQIGSVMQDHLANKNGFGSMGIRNVDERIKLTYGQQYGLQISSFPGMYTRVTIGIPDEE